MSRLGQCVIDGEVHALPRFYAEAIVKLTDELAECREKCAVEAWVHYMDVCKKRGVSPDTFYHWCAADAIRTATRKGKEKP